MQSYKLISALVDTSPHRLEKFKISTGARDSIWHKSWYECRNDAVSFAESQVWNVVWTDVRTEARSVTINVFDTVSMAILTDSRELSRRRDAKLS